MTPLDWLLISFCLAATFLHIVTSLLAMRRCRQGTGSLPAPARAPLVSILRPVRGLDRCEEVTLASSFALDYPNFELIFCCADADDPAVACIRSLIARNPGVKARLLIGNHEICLNPKLNNLVKGWRAAAGDWIVFADSNVLMPRDYLQRLFAGWQPDTGVLCAPPIACNVIGFWSEVECAFLNGYQARWQYAADSVGMGFAQGKTMLIRRSDLAQAGGIQVLAQEIAEDAAVTKLVHSMGLCVALVDAPFGQPLGPRTARQVWDRQTRWARLRRLSFPGFFAIEILTGCLLPLAAAVWVADALEMPPAALLAGLSAVWFGTEALLAWVAGWHVRVWSPLAWALRDALLPLVWMHAWLSEGYAWRGNEISTVQPSAPMH